MLASWDEDENDEPPFYEQPFYIVIDEANIHHIVKFYRNDSLNIMRGYRGRTPLTNNEKSCRIGIVE